MGVRESVEFYGGYDLVDGADEDGGCEHAFCFCIEQFVKFFAARGVVKIVEEGGGSRVFGVCVGE